MGEVISASDQQSMVSSFLEIAVGQTTETARQFLQVSLSFFLNFLDPLRLDLFQSEFHGRRLWRWGVLSIFGCLNLYFFITSP